MKNKVIDFNLTEEEQRENLIKAIDSENISKNLAYQVILNKFSLTPYLYEMEQFDSIFENYKKIAKSNISDYTLHPFQVKVLNELKNGNNLIVSAPTSFGKTASIFEYISLNKNKLKKILIIVPTIALRNEYLEKINDCLSKHIIITNSNDLEKYNSFCLILTHERFVEYFVKNTMNKLDVDLLVIDEIYKLQNESNSERMYSMSLAYLTAIKLSKQFIFLGPFINSIKLPDIENYKVLKFDYSPIATSIEYKPEKSFNAVELKENINYKEKTLVYFSNKNDIIRMANDFTDRLNEESKNVDLINYISNEYGSDWIEEWSIIKALKYGIGIHYNELPSFIKEYVLDSYNNSNETMILFATSTLLEGVNTATKKLIITSDQIGNNRLSDFEFWNLVGRAGRLGKYRVGNVVYFGGSNDFKKENRYIDLDKFWINDELNKDEYEIINNGKLSDTEKQEKLNGILYKYKISIDEIKFIYLPYFLKIDAIIDFFECIYPKMLEKIETQIKEAKGMDKSPSRNIRMTLFDDFIKKYKKPSNIGPLPSNHFSILSDAINMSYKTRTQKIKNIVNSGRKNLEKIKDEDKQQKNIRMNNLYNYSFYMVNNYIENSYIPGVNILKKLFNDNNSFSKDDNDILNKCIFKQVETYITMSQNDEIYETLGIITPLIVILKETFNNKLIKNISELKKNILENKEKILNRIQNDNLCRHYFEILLKKLKL